MASIVVSGDSSGAVTIAAPSVAGTTTLTLPTTSGTIVTTAGASQLTTSGNLTFTGTGNRITGDFDNATLSNRVAFQTSTTNANTTLTILPNGTAGGSFLTFYQFASNQANSSVGSIGLASGASVFRIENYVTGTGAYFPITINTGGSERLRIDTSGNVGIGTSSPAQKLDVAGNISGNDYIIRNTAATIGYTGTNGAGIEIYGSTNATPNIVTVRTSNTERMRISAAGNIFAPFNNDSTASLVVGGNGTATSLGARICVRSPIAAGASINYAMNINDSNTNIAGGGNFIAWSHNSEDYSAINVRAAIGATIDAGGAGSLLFRTGSYNAQAERMRITSGGDVFIGGSTTSAGPAVIGKGGAAGGSILQFFKPNSGATNVILNYFGTSTYVGGMNMDNTSTSFITSSDIRLKKNIVDAPSAISKVENIRVVSHGWKNDDAVVEFGVIAQELASVAPNAVMQGDDGEEVVTTWSVDYSKLVPLLTKAIQELKAELDEAKAEIQALKGAK